MLLSASRVYISGIYDGVQEYNIFKNKSVKHLNKSNEIKLDTILLNHNGYFVFIGLFWESGSRNETLKY